VIALRGIAKSYPLPGGEARALDGVDLDIGAGEALCITGKSGSGKTTLLDIIATLLKPTQGSYRFDGEEVSSLSEQALARLRNRRFGFVFQSFHLLPEMSVLDNVCLPALYRGGEDLRPAARHWLDALGLGDLGGRRPVELSGGQQQRVAIARALVTDPAVLLADEPTGNLDSATGAEVVELLLGVAKAGRTLILVTHDNELAASFPRRVTLADGRVVAG
jgi:putative ABC transport system ATP-binding protein